MPTVHELTNKYLDALRPLCRDCERKLREAGRPERPGCEHTSKATYEVNDESGLTCIVQKSGARALLWRYRRPEKPFKHASITFGRYPAPNALKNANRDLLKAKHDRANGVDPAKKREAVVPVIAADTYSIALEKWWIKDGKVMRTGLKSYNDQKRLVLPTFGKREVASIKGQADFVPLHAAIWANNGHRMADMVCGLARRIVNEDVRLSDDPDRREIPEGLWATSNTPRERILNNDELRAVWTAAEGPFGDLAKVILLTMGRRNEIAQLLWSELDETGTTITIPAARYKTERAQR
jgi:hypothetical protein